MQQPDAGGGWRAIKYTWETGRRVGLLNLWRAMRTKNTCKTCALGMGGQLGGMRNELGRFPEFCKKSLQAMAADMQGEVNPDLFANFSLDQMRGFSPSDLEHAGRLVQPVYAAAGASHYTPVSWDEAYAVIVRHLKAVDPAEAFFYFSGRSSNEAGFLLQLFARIYGTNHVSNCSYYCHQASGAGLTGSTGSSTASVEVTDIEHADLFFLIGGNPASNHPRLMTHLYHLKKNGGKVVVINPVKETGLVKFRVPSKVGSLLFGTAIADTYIQPDIGGDLALFIGMAKRLIETNAVDQAFIDRATNGWEAVKDLTAQTSWEAIAKASGVDADTIRALADQYAQAERAVFAWTMGITHHTHGVSNVQWIANLALMRGMVGKPHAGLMPIRGHSNVQGMGTIGVVPKLKPGIVQRFAEHGLPLPDLDGLDTLGAMEAADAGQMKVGFAMGGNLFGANPDAGFAARALGKLDLMVYFNTALNTGHTQGTGKETLILPVLARDEEPYTSTQESMFSYVRLSDGGLPRHEGPRSEVDTVCDIAQRVVGDRDPIRWDTLRDADAIRSWLGKLIPGMEPVSDIGKTKKEFHIHGRILHGGNFPTEDGRACFHAHPIPAPPAANGHQLKLMSVRSEGQFNTVVYEEEDLYRGQERRDVILLNENDMQRLGLKTDQCVTVKSDTGLLPGIRVRPFDIRAGNALMYYPECNILIPRTVDPVSRTPSYKMTWISLQPGAEDAASTYRPRQRNTIPQALRRRKKPGLKTC